MVLDPANADVARWFPVESCRRSEYTIACGSNGGCSCAIIAAVPRDGRGGAQMTTFRPMLSATCEDINKIRTPTMASPKLDGIRCVIRNGKPLTRTLKPIPNRYVRERLTGLPAFDGELIVGSPVASDVWNVTSSGIMSEEGEPAFAFFVFDLVAEDPKAHFVHRYKRASDLVEAKCGVNWLMLLEHIHISNLAELEAYEAKSVELGFEG